MLSTDLAVLLLWHFKATDLGVSLKIRQSQAKWNLSNIACPLLSPDI